LTRHAKTAGPPRLMLDLARAVIPGGRTAPMTLLVSIDNGGTLTDICVSDGGQMWHVKTLTTPHDLSQCLFDGLATAAALVNATGRASPGQASPASLVQAADVLRYSTTQGTNALVQRRGPRVGLLVSDKDLPCRMRAAAEQPDLFDDLLGDRVAVIDPETSDLAGRLTASVNGLTLLGARRLVVCLSGPRHASHERQMRRAVLRVFPRHLLGAVPVLFAHELTADRDAVRRAWSAVLNAFLHESMETFLFNTGQRLRGQHPRRPLLIFGNDGASSRISKSCALRSYSSGPRGGLEGTRALAGFYGHAHALMLDVGGTTTDLGEVLDGQIRSRPRGTIAGAPVSLATSDITSLGVGGSSVIRVEDGHLRVGPHSVGAAPGPACFGLGGTAATITDACLLMGMLDPGTYLNGSLALDRSRSERAVVETIAQPLGLGLAGALEAMSSAFLDRVAEAIPAGRVAADTVLIAFGGAGPLAALGVAARTGIGRVVVPRTAAIFSAFGIGFSDLGQTYEEALDTVSADTVRRGLERLRERAGRDMAGEGISPSGWSARASLVWESGQARREFEIPAAGDLPGAALAAEPGEAACLVLSARAEIAHNALDVAARRSRPAARRTRPLLGRTGYQQVPVYVLAELDADAMITGPAIIEGSYFTMAVPAPWLGCVTRAGDLSFVVDAADRGDPDREA
jgi:N-methylhydantoinase A